MATQREEKIALIVTLARDLSLDDRRNTALVIAKRTPAELSAARRDAVNSRRDRKKKTTQKKVTA
jgi:hypothetical protein